MKNKLLWKPWIGKVIGSGDEIKAAIERLRRNPKDVKELQDNIFKARQEAEDHMTTEINKELYKKNSV